MYEDTCRDGYGYGDQMSDNEYIETEVDSQGCSARIPESIFDIQS